jgi:hypothetical protein
MDNLKTEATVMALANAGLTGFELITKKKGLGALTLGGASLGYAAYTYWQNSKKVQQNKNWGDYVGDVFKGGLDVFTGGVEGAGFIVKNSGLILLGVGGLAGLYVVTRFVSITPPPTAPGVLDLDPSSIPVMIGGAMGMVGALILYLDESIVEEDAIGAIAHDAGVATESSLASLEGMVSTEGWGKFENNVTHPGQYFDKYGKQVSTAWSNVNSPGSFVNAMGWTAQVIGDAFAL